MKIKMCFASFGLLKMVSNNTNTRDLSLVQSAHHPLPSLRFIKQLALHQTARDSTTQLKSSLRQGEFNLTKFVSNTNDAINSIDGGEVSTNATVHRVLGVKWDTTVDTIFVQPTTRVTNTKSTTLRTILSTVARVFDHLGIVAPFVIKLKILLQNMWKSGISWDKTVPSEFVPIIDKWVDQCKQVPPVRLPRLLGPQLSPSDIQLHVFCDASQDAMATCIYFRTA